jgi:hypothetical protein
LTASDHVQGQNPSNMKMAETALGPVMASVQGPAPEQGPDQPRKMEPGVGLAVSVTAVPLA